MIKHRLGVVFTVALLVLAVGSAMCADTFVATGLIGYWGASVRSGTTTEAVVQPFAPAITGWVDRIGIGMAQAQDPNHVGFKVTMMQISSEDKFSPSQLPGTPIAESWTMKPAQGAALAWSYIDIDPLFVDRHQTYGLLIEPGDDQMWGSVAECINTVPLFKTADDWATNSLVSPYGYTACIRLYGTQSVPEPSSLLALFCGIGGVGGVMWRRKKS